MHDHTTMLPVVPVDEPPSNEPRSAALPLGRVLLGLAVAPLLGAALMTVGIGFVDSIFPQDERGIQWRYLALSLASPSLWSVFCGLAYLQTVTRLRGQIARSECLLLGCASGFLMPFAMDAVDTLIWHAHLPAMT